MISHWLESRALLVQSKTSGMSLSEPISLCALEIITFIAWIAGLGRRGGGCLMAPLQICGGGGGMKSW